MAKSINPDDSIDSKTINSSNKSDYASTPMPSQRNRRSLLLLMAVFILPILLAKLALDNQWLNLGVTNQGKLLTQPLTLKDLGISESELAKQWLITVSYTHLTLPTTPYV